MIESSITDDVIIEWLQTGAMTVDLVTCDLTFRGNSIKAFKVGEGGRNSSGSRFAFGIRCDGERRTIVRSKLVYMAGTLAPIPPGFVVHHLNEDRYDDRFANLIAISCEDHNKLHGQFFETADNIPF